MARLMHTPPCSVESTQLHWHFWNMFKNEFFSVPGSVTTSYITIIIKSTGAGSTTTNHRFVTTALRMVRIHETFRRPCPIGSGIVLLKNYKSQVVCQRQQRVFCTFDSIIIVDRGRWVSLQHLDRVVLCQFLDAGRVSS
jgi:hypothetical protein